MNSSIGFPEGYLVLFILFFFPFMMARKNVFNLEKIIHEYMSDTETYIQRFINIPIVYRVMTKTENLIQNIQIQLANRSRK